MFRGRKSQIADAARRLLRGLVLTAAIGSALHAAEPPRVGDLGGADPMVRERIEEAWQAAADLPSEAGRWLELAKVYHAHQFTDLAAECYRRAVELAPEEPRSRYLLAHAEAELGLVASAVRGLEQVIGLAPGYAPAHWRLGDWRMDLGRAEDARAAYRRSVELDESVAAGWIGLGRIALEGGDARSAVDILQRVVDADPTNGVAGQLLGRALHATGDETGARRALAMTTGMGAYFPDPWYEEMLRAATGVGNLLRLLSARMERGEIDAVMTELEALRRSHPRDVGVLNKLSEGHLHRRDPVAALEVLWVAYEVDPEEYATLVHVAQGERMRGDLEAALRWVDRAVAANPRFWQVHFERAAILHLMRSYEECVGSLEDALRLGAHQNPNVWLMKGDAHIRLSDWEGAAATFGPAAERFPFLGQAFSGLAIARVEQGRIADARRALEEAEKLQPEDRTMALIRQRIEELEAAEEAG